MAESFLEFARPAGLWALAALLVLLLFSLWLPRPARRIVPSARLWKRIPRRAPPVRAARRPRLSFVLILQSLAIGAIAGGLAEPSVRGSAAPPRRIAVVVDTTARMNARRADGRTRFEAARAAAVEAARGLSILDRAVVTWLDDAPRRWEGPGSELAAKLGEIRPLERRGDLAPLVETAVAAGGEVWFLSDRPWTGPRGNAPFVEFLAGEPADNTGIAWAAIEGDEVFVRLVRFGPAKETEISIRADGRELARERIRVDGTRAWWRRIETGPAREIVVSIPAGDQLALDDAVAARRSDPEDGVRLGGPEHPLLARALQSLPGVRLGRGRTAVLYRTLEGAGETTVYVDPPAEPPGFRLGERFAPREWTIADHPLVRDLRREDLSSAGAREVTGGTPLLWADGRCVAAVRGQNVVLAFELTAGHWTSTVSFPVFWTNAVEFARTGATWRFTEIPDERESDTGGEASSGVAKSPPGAGVPFRKPAAAFACGLALGLVMLSWLLRGRQ